MPLTARDIAGLLKAKRNVNGSYQAICPAHEDNRPSLSIADGDKGVVLYCHAGCSFEEICAKLNVETADLMRPSDLWDRHFSDASTLSIAEFLNEKPPEPAILNSIAPFDPETIPRKIWLHGTNVLAGKISILAGHGGRGKSLLALHRVVAIASGIPITGEAVKRRKVWLISLEDDINDLRERITGISIGHNLEQADYAENLMVSSFDQWFSHIGGKTFAEILESIIATIQANKIGLLMVDPLGHFLQIDENDNKEMGEFMKQIQTIARKTECAVLFIHHSRKTMPGGKTDGLDLRGASAIHAHARIIEIVNRLPEAEAETMGITGTEKKNIIRIENDKGNFAELADSICYRFEAQELPNGGISPSMHKIIEINSMDWLTTEMQMRCWEIVDARSDLRESSRAKKWCGIIFSEFLQLNHNSRSDRSKILQAVNYMLEIGVLRTILAKEGTVIVAGTMPQ